MKILKALPHKKNNAPRKRIIKSIRHALRFAGKQEIRSSEQ